VESSLESRPRGNGMRVLGALLKVLVILVLLFLIVLPARA
jgi:hypothetical protein